jgi:PAS domain S-box-containing protein
VVHDVTQLREAARALQESEERFRAVFESSPIGIALVDTSTQRLVQANRSFLDLIGYTSAELTELTVADITHPEDWAREQESVHRRLDGTATGYSFEKRYVRKGGAVRDVIVVGEVVRLGLEQSTLAVASVIDITERKQVEREVAESRENLRLLARRADEAREDERTRIARELHDRIGQTFTALKFDVDRLRKLAPDGDAGVLPLLDTMQSLLAEGADDVRRMSSELRPGALDDLGLAGAIGGSSIRFVLVPASTSRSPRVMRVSLRRAVSAGPWRSSACFRSWSRTLSDTPAPRASMLPSSALTTGGCWWWQTTVVASICARLRNAARLALWACGNACCPTMVSCIWRVLLAPELWPAL